MPIQKQLKTVRTTEGLRNMLFDELDKLRNGKATAQQANAISKLTVQIINSAKLELEIKQMALEQEITISGAPLLLGSK